MNILYCSVNLKEKNVKLLINYPKAFETHNPFHIQCNAYNDWAALKGNLCIFDNWICHIKKFKTANENVWGI